MPKSKETISSSGSESGTASSEEEKKQKSKARKPEKKKDSSDSASDNSESEEDTKAKKRPKKQDDKASSKKAKKDSKNDEDETCWELGGNKQVNVRNFKNKWFVDIREMYMDKDGELKPGRKGVCLNMENWKSFMKVVQDVDKAVKAKCN